MRKALMIVVCLMCIAAGVLLEAIFHRIAKLTRRAK